MHSGRMRTGRSSTVCRSLLPGGGCLLWGGCLLRGGEWGGGGEMWHPSMHWGGVSAPGGLCSRGVVLQGGCLLWMGVCSQGWGVSALGGVSAPRGICSRGVSAPRGVISQHALRQTPPPREQNDKQVQKYYLGHNFVAACNYDLNTLCDLFTISYTKSVEYISV